ncbi:hypothetical protein UA08_05137 [Talaromyces atroroseus]|uniref:NTF2 domain-containing protein n=1 Tax=Talaromyces atroroseus TaxID=1441469 RepID=A0A225AUS8_TALAT|nr:hypothetical protein UA08_05137 [Talaromyces atroroseus]OKL59339.1 hypothetical protein UA08_05137 [Talaromyces atroroseus]
MADTTQAPVNGTYAAPPSHYADAYMSHATMNNAGGSYHPVPASTPSNAPASDNKNDIPKDEVGWYFVEQYYTTMSRNPEKLHLFYSRRSQFVSGNEADAVPVIVGAKAISDKIKELDFQDCKVRVLNVDSQASFDNILVAVIGEISNRSEPSRKFTQTFVLAQQPNGYYVLNDIFRYLADEDEDFVPEEEVAAVELEVPVEPETAAVTKEDEAPETEEAAVPTEPAAAETDAEAVGTVAAGSEPEKVEEPAAPAQINGDAAHEKAAVPVTPAVPVVPTETETLKPEKPQTPEPTPAVNPPQESAPAAKKEAAPAKAVPKTWATIASNNRASAAAAAAAAATPAAPQPKPTAVATSSQQAAQPQQEQPATASPTEVVATGSQAAPNDGAGWQTAGHDHGKKQSRTEEKYSAYIKNVTDKVDAALLRSVLARFGKLSHFDVNRARNCAFVDFADQAAYNAAVAANPHQIGSEQVTVEERRVRSGNFGNGFAAGRGGGSGANRGGRSDGRAGSQGRGGSGFQREQGRGGFASRGRGGSNVNKGRSQAQAA